jgi:undecaprenyl diphosphate synthase
LHKEGIPQHVAIIMDGNGRWAKARHLPRFRGHMEGVKRVEEIAAAANSLGVKVLTIFAFSTENWSRPKQEVSMLMKTLGNVLSRRLERLIAENIRLRFTGQRKGVPPEVMKTVDRSIAQTRHNTGMVLNLALNYGARQELVEAVQEISALVQKGDLAPSAIDEKMISGHLYTAGLPDPDLLIRTSGEQRISNFLLWQLSYSEFYFTPVFWTDFDSKELEKALREYQCRDRRYGRVSAKA